MKYIVIYNERTLGNSETVSTEIEARYYIINYATGIVSFHNEEKPCASFSPGWIAVIENEDEKTKD